MIFFIGLIVAFVLTFITVPVAIALGRGFQLWRTLPERTVLAYTLFGKVIGQVDEPGLLLQLVRERVTASIVWQRHVPVTSKHGVRIIGRRAPGARGSVTWFYEFDEQLNPADPQVRAAAEQALTRAREGLGED